MISSLLYQSDVRTQAIEVIPVIFYEPSARFNSSEFLELFEAMFNRRRIVEVILILIAFAICDAASSSRRVVISDEDAEKFLVDAMKSILKEVNEIREEVAEEGNYLRDTETVVEAMCHEFRYPVKTRLELTNTEAKRSEPVTTRFRRNDRATVTQNRNGSSKDYMSTYYAQRKAIMEKYKSQQNEIMERFEKTKRLIAARKRLKESRRTDSDKVNVTRDQPPHASRPNLTSYDDRNSTIISNLTASSGSVDFNRTTTTSNSTPAVPIFNSPIFNDTQGTSSNESKSFFESSDDETTDESTEGDAPSTTSSPVYETLRPLLPNADETEITERPDVRTLEENWSNETANLIPQNEVDFNLTEETLVRQERDNDTLIIDLGGRHTNPLGKNDSAFEQLEKMFRWDERVTDDDFTVKNVKNVSAEDRSENSSQSSDSLRFMVEINSSPEVHMTNNIKNVRTSTTTYRNSTHEIIEIDGVVNSTKRIDESVPPDVDLSYSKDINLTNTNVTTPGAEMGGGAKESEWCEECPHDYRWGECEGTLFYQHNVFLRNRGPSAIDAIFGMNVQGPVDITCVEAIRFNKTRGIVTLHSGGPGHDFAKLRIRGFEGEGFSYIIKVWGVSNEELVDASTTYPY